MMQKENELTEFQKELVKLFYTYDFSTDERRKDIAIRYSPILLEKIKKDIDISNTKQLLDNAIDYIYELLKHSGYDICKFLHDIPEENTICANTCKNMKKECVLRFLKHYKNGKNIRRL